MSSGQRCPHGSNINRWTLFGQFSLCWQSIRFNRFFVLKKYRLMCPRKSQNTFGTIWSSLTNFLIKIFVAFLGPRKGGSQEKNLDWKFNAFSQFLGVIVNFRKNFGFRPSNFFCGYTWYIMKTAFFGFWCVFKELRSHEW